MNEVVALAFRHDPHQTPSIMPLSTSRLNILPVCLSSLCLCLTLLYGAPLRAQGFEVWSSGEETEGIWDLQKAQTGGWLGSGFWGPSQAYDCWVWRVDDYGVPMWSYVHEKEGEEFLSGAVEMPNGEWVVVGRTTQWDGFSPEPYQMFLLHLDANGILLEEKEWASDLSVVAQHALLDGSNNNILVTGWKESEQVDNEGFLRVLNPELEMVDEVTFGLGDTRMTHIMQDAEGDFYLSGTDLTEDSVSFVLYKFDESYNLLDSTSMSFAEDPTLASNGAWMNDDHVFFAVSDKDENNDWRAGVVRYAHDLSGGAWLPFEQGYSICDGGHPDVSMNVQTVVGHGFDPETGNYGIWTRHVSNSFTWLDEPSWLTMEHPLQVLRCVHFSDSQLGLGGRLEEAGNSQGFIKVVDSPASIEAPSAISHQLSIYPNPTPGVVHVEPPSGGAMNDLIWHDALGNNVTSLIRQTGPRDFDVSRLPAGHYTVTIEGAKSSKASATLVKLP